MRLWSWVRGKVGGGERTPSAAPLSVEQLEPRLLLDATVTGSEYVDLLQVSLAEPAIVIDLLQEDRTAATYQSPASTELASSDGTRLAQMEVSVLSTPDGAGERSLIEQPLDEVMPASQLELEVSESLAGAPATQVETGTQIETGSNVLAEAFQDESSGSVVTGQETIIDSDVSPTTIRGPPADAQLSSIASDTTSSYSTQSSDLLLSASLDTAVNPVTHDQMYAGVDVQPSTGGLRASDLLSLPASYDLRVYGYVPPVENQGQIGSCWTFGTYGSLESNILFDGGAALDLSENHLKNYHGFDWGPTSGGNYYISQAYLSRWDGPVSEADDPYHDYDDRPSPGGPPQYYVREVLELDTDEDLKTALMTYGAVGTSMYFNAAYYNAASKTYYYNGATNANHAVTIVGWDDNHVVPGAPGPGAWLIQNSWGATWGDAGYFWLSYLDSRGANDGFCFHDAVAPDTFDKVYYYDDFGAVGSWIFPYGFNAYTATSDQDLVAVQFWTMADGASYEVKIYDSFSGGWLLTLLGSASGTFTYAGVHTVDLPSPVHLTEGNDFYIYLHITDGGSYPLAADWAVSGYSSSATASPGQSYYSSDGITWADLTTRRSTANFSIKGLVTTTTPPEITVIGNGASISDGDTTPSLADDTNFGGVAVGGTAVSRTFTVRNTGTGRLMLQGVTVPAGFALTEGLSTSLAPGASDTFTVRLNTASVGIKRGDIVIRNDDSDEHPFNFRITGTVLGPEITVLGNGESISDGSTTSDTIRGTIFPSVIQGGTPSSRTYTVVNEGTSILTLGAVVVPTGFTLIEGLSESLAPGASDTFTVQLDTAVAGDKAGDVYFTNNDTDENPFNFRIVGTVQVPTAEITVLGNGVSIADGDITPDYSDGTNMGGSIQGGAPGGQDFTVRNDGTSTLTLGPITVPAGFVLVEGLSASLEPGASDTFTIGLDTTVAGVKTGDISFSNNDSDENPFSFRVTGRVLPPPDITVLCNGVIVTDGDTTPSAADGTDFGAVYQGGLPVVRTFVVRNDGGSTLWVDTAYVPSGFVMADPLLPGSIEPGASKTFTIRLEPGEIGVKSGEVSFANGDSDENPFNFQITGVVAAAVAPEVTVQGNGTTITDGDTTPSAADGTDFGSVAQGGSPISRVFTVRNDGTATLMLGAVTVPTGFTLTEGLSTSLAPGASDTFTVRLETATVGTKSGQISFSTNDSDENPFNFTIIGVVTGGAAGSVPAEQFLGGADSFDLANKAVMFTPGTSGYTTTIQSISALPTDPTAGMGLGLSDDSYARVNLSAGATVSLFGQSYSSFFVGSNGYITFGQADMDSSESLADHFNAPRISALFTDLNPEAGGTVSVRQLSDRVVVTWQGVAEYGASSTNTFQIEMYFDGRIQLAWLSIASPDGIVGLSNGLGVPGGFAETDFSTLGPA